ncbi:MAG TPA: tetratricopeptide repeat protein [Bryobacteraceae bacterium]|jgi:tetratricopeptide (TPR) repeat protein|nr:tetratricopeptide repeat protein [Bryobacteraceae bacterium]
MRTILTLAALVATAAVPVLAQQAPKPKSQKEVDALKKVQADAQAGNADQEIQDINYVLENFADTEYKDMLLNMAMEAAQRKGDYPQTVAFGEQVIKNNPNDVTARVTLAETIAAHTKDTDLDKDKSIQQVRDYANKALDLLKGNVAPPSGVPADKWPDFEKQLTSQAHDALAQALELEKKYPEAITEYKAALDAQPTNSVSMVRLAKAYNENKQYDDAIATADKALAVADAPPAVKTFAQQQKDVATRMKGSPK